MNKKKRPSPFTILTKIPKLWQECLGERLDDAIYLRRELNRLKRTSIAFLFLPITLRILALPSLTEELIIQARFAIPRLHKTISRRGDREY